MKPTLFRHSVQGLGALLSLSLGAGALAVLTDDFVVDNRRLDSLPVTVDYIEIALKEQFQACSEAMDWQRIDRIAAQVVELDLLELTSTTLFTAVAPFCVRSTASVPLALSLRIENVVESERATSAAECTAEALIPGVETPCGKTGELGRFLQFSFGGSPASQCFGGGGEAASFNTLVTPGTIAPGAICGGDLEVAVSRDLDEQEYFQGLETDRYQFDLVLTAAEA